MKDRSIIIAGSWAHCGLIVLGLTAAAIGFAVACGCAVQGVIDGVASEWEE